MLIMATLLLLCVIVLALLTYVIIETWKCKREKEEEMTVKEFARQVTLKEGGKISISIAQVLEVLKIVNTMLGGKLYKAIREG